jgi:hypothetical protein
MTDRRVDVNLDEPRVAVGGGGPLGATLLRQPGSAEERPEGGRPTLSRRRPDSFGSQTVGDSLRLVTVTADGVPSLPFLARQGIDALIVDDIEAVFPLNDVGHASRVDDFEANPMIINHSTTSRMTLTPIGASETR